MGRALFAGPMIQLRTVPAFDALSSRQLAALAQDTEEVMVPRGELLLERGRPAEALVLIIDGRAEVVRAEGSDELSSGAVVGFLESLSRTPAPQTVMAYTDLVGLRLEAEALREACDAHFGILGSLLAHVAGLATGSPEVLAEAVGDEGRASGEALESPLSRVDRILALHRSPVFPSAGMDALAELAGHFTERRLEEGTGLWPSLEGPEGAFLIIEGRVSMESDHWKGSVVLGPGSVPGLVTALAEEPVGIRARALTAVRALYVSRETLLDVLEDHLDMAFAFLGRLATCVLEGGGTGATSEPEGSG